MTGCTHVQKNGIAFSHEFSGYDDAYTASLKKLADAAKSQGAPAILQLNHGGNKALPDLAEDVVSASSVPTQATPFAPSLTPRELTDAEIRVVIKDFGRAAQRAIAAGFDGVELHGAHGFLIQQLLSPYFNKRTDDWGGSLANRMRFALAIVREIKAVMAASHRPDFILGYRISPDEPMADGLKVADTLALADELIALGVDYIHTSLMVAGSVQTGEQAQAVLEQGADLVAVAHGLVTDPNWVEKVQAGESPNLSLKRSSIA